MSNVAIAFEMYKREHERWNQWALFYFGSIGSVFLGWSQMRETVPLWVPAFAAGLLSVAWVLVANNIRASTRSWFDTMIDMERDDQGRPFTKFKAHYNSKNRCRDLQETVALWKPEPYRRVTRILVLTGAFAALGFLGLGAWSLFDHDLGRPARVAVVQPCECNISHVAPDSEPTPAPSPAPAATAPSAPPQDPPAAAPPPADSRPSAQPSASPAPAGG